ncbi:18842_t:CDS:1, partial [Funneliformis geosporum]
VCIEKKLMITRPDVCPFLDCGMKVDIIYPVSTSARRGSQSFQSSGTSALSNLIGEKFNLFSSIPEDPMEEVKDTCSAEDSSKKRTNTSTEELTSKKKKTSDKEGDSAMLKKLVKELKDDSNNQELSFPTQSPEDSYTHLYKEIVKAKTQNDSASQRVLLCYFQFGKKIYERLDYYKNEKKYRDRMAQSKVDKETKEQLPEGVTDTTRWKQTERARKIYELFFEIGVDKIQ